MRRKQTKRLLSLLLSLVMMLSLASAALAAGLFTDVPAGAWYAKDVESAVANGLVNGTSATTFSPDKNLTYAEAVKLAAAMHKKMTTGTADFAVGTPWYQTYVDYARAHHIISGDYDWTANATRAGYMEIFANAIPGTGLLSGYTPLREINRIDDNAIPDVPMSHAQAGAIYTLYRAGILQGSDAAHNCAPASSIRRSEVAAILTRIMDVSKHIRFSMTGEIADELQITGQPESSITVTAGTRTKLRISVTGGTGEPRFQWRRSPDGKSWEDVRDGAQYSGADTRTLTVEASQETAGYAYKCVVTDNAGKYVESNSCRLTLSVPPLTVTKQPQDVSAQADEWITFTVAVSGGKAPYTYCWENRADHESAWTELPLDNPDYVKNADTASIRLRADTTDWNYGYQYRCKITDATGTVVCSDGASILEAAALRIDAQPSDCSPAGSGKAAFSVSVSGGKAPYSYEWFAAMDTSSDKYWFSCNDGDLTDLSGVLSDRLTAAVDASTILLFYRCEITDAAGSKVTSQPVRIKLANADVFAENPQNVTLRGRNEIVSTHVTLQDWCANALPSYKWQYRASADSEWQDCTSERFFGADTEELSFCDSGTYDMKGCSFRCAVTLWGANTMYSDTATATSPQRPGSQRLGSPRT